MSLLVPLMHVASYAIVLFQLLFCSYLCGQKDDCLATDNVHQAQSIVFK